MDERLYVSPILQGTVRSSSVGRTRPALRLLIAGAAIVTLVLQATLALRERNLLAYRAMASTWSLGLVVWAWRSEDVQIGGLLTRLAYALGAAAVFWLAVLEVMLLRGPLLARGVLAIAAASLVHATILLFATTKEGASGADLVNRLVLASASALVAVLAVETAFQAIKPASVYDLVPDDPRSGPGLITHPGVPNLLRPGFRGHFMHPEFPGLRVDINALGFRDTLDDITAPGPGEASVLVLGDSLVFGTGVDVEQTFHHILERRGGEIATARLRVYGAGVPGFGQWDELHYLDELAPFIRPDVVVVGLYEGNDLEDNLRAKVRDTRRGEPPPSPLPTSDRPLLVRFLLGVIGRRPFWLGSSAALQYVLPAVEGPLVRLGLLDPAVPTNEMFDSSLLVSPPPVVTDALETTRAALRALAGRCDELHAVLVVLVIPAVIQAEPARFRDFVSLHSKARQPNYSRTQLHEEIVQMIQSLGVVVVDPLPALEAEAVAGRPCYHREGHWNAAGHRVAAEALAPVLREIFARPR